MKNMQKGPFRTAVTRTLSFSLCNADRDFHGQEEGQTIGLQLNQNPLEEKEKNNRTSEPLGRDSKVS